VISGDDGAATAALTAGRSALVWRRMIADTETPVSAALKLIEPGRSSQSRAAPPAAAIR